ncbi:response regulator [Tumidithrix elongata RA019]|uniref:Response regulator n=1 Tax=Tumidithrix elongata BACA0141 TaxID=2716417 RepID=A0AAW9Q0E0_9CYAN|nr:response regulator [Tumidithrix elongata RA019]
MTAQKILVIDDSIMIRKMVKSILADKYEVLEANDGKTGLDAARRIFPDLILLDFVMPKYNGYQTLQAIRRVEGLQDTPVIMISGLKEQVAEHVPEPFVGFEFLEKPFEAEVLVSRIQSLLSESTPQSAAQVIQPVVSFSAPLPPPPLKERDVTKGGEEPTLQTVMAKLTSTETLLVQGIENLVQREVVARINALSDRVDKQDAVVASLEQRLDRIQQLIEHQNKGLMVILKEIKALHAAR